MPAAELLTDLSRATDSNSDPLAGAKWYFYLTGTTTPQNVYTTASLATPLSNPVVADAGGLFPSIYFNSDIQYRGILKTAAGVTIKDLDPINAAMAALFAASGGAALIGFLQSGSGATARTAQDKLREFVSVKDFGALVDGTTNDQSAIASVVADTRDAEFGPGVHRFNTGNFAPVANSKKRGAGRENTFLRNGHATNNSFSGSANFVSLSDFTVDRVGAVAGKGIAWSGNFPSTPLEGFSAKRINVSGHATGIELKDFVIASVEDAYLQNCPIGFEAGVTGSTASTMLHLRNMWIRQNSTACAKFTTVVGVTLDQVAFEGAGIVGPLGVEATSCASMLFQNCWWEKLAQGMSATSCSTIHFNGGRFDGAEITTQAFYFYNCPYVVFDGAWAVDNLGSDYFVTADTGTVVRVRSPEMATLAMRALNGGKIIYEFDLVGGKTWDPASVAASTLGTGTTVTVTGARPGDICIATFDNATTDPQTFLLKADCFTNDTVTVRPLNADSAAHDLASGTLSVTVRKKALVS